MSISLSMSVSTSVSTSVYMSVSMSVSMKPCTIQTGKLVGRVTLRPIKWLKINDMTAVIKNNG